MNEQQEIKFDSSQIAFLNNIDDGHESDNELINNKIKELYGENTTPIYFDMKKYQEKIKFEKNSNQIDEIIRRNLLIGNHFKYGETRDTETETFKAFKAQYLTLFKKLGVILTARDIVYCEEGMNAYCENNICSPESMRQSLIVWEEGKKRFEYVIYCIETNNYSGSSAVINRMLRDLVEDGIGKCGAGFYSRVGNLFDYITMPTSLLANINGSRKTVLRNICNQVVLVHPELGRDGLGNSRNEGGLDYVTHDQNRLFNVLAKRFGFSEVTLDEDIMGNYNKEFLSKLSVFYKEVAQRFDVGVINDLVDKAYELLRYKVLSNPSAQSNTVNNLELVDNFIAELDKIGIDETYKNNNEGETMPRNVFVDSKVVNKNDVSHTLKNEETIKVYLRHTIVNRLLSEESRKKYLNPAYKLEENAPLFYQSQWTAHDLLIIYRDAGKSTVLDSITLKNITFGKQDEFVEATWQNMTIINTVMPKLKNNLFYNVNFSAGMSFPLLENCSLLNVTFKLTVLSESTLDQSTCAELVDSGIENFIDCRIHVTKFDDFDIDETLFGEKTTLCMKFTDVKILLKLKEKYKQTSVAISDISYENYVKNKDNIKKLGVLYTPDCIETSMLTLEERQTLPKGVIGRNKTHGKVINQETFLELIKEKVIFFSSCVLQGIDFDCEAFRENFLSEQCFFDNCRLVSGKVPSDIALQLDKKTGLFYNSVTFTQPDCSQIKFINEKYDKSCMISEGTINGIIDDPKLLGMLLQGKTCVKNNLGKNINHDMLGCLIKHGYSDFSGKTLSNINLHIPMDELQRLDDRAPVNFDTNNDTFYNFEHLKLEKGFCGLSQLNILLNYCQSWMTFDQVNFVGDDIPETLIGFDEVNANVLKFNNCTLCASSLKLAQLVQMKKFNFLKYTTIKIAELNQQLSCHDLRVHLERFSDRQWRLIIDLHSINTSKALQWLLDNERPWDHVVLQIGRYESKQDTTAKLNRLCEGNEAVLGKLSIKQGEYGTLTALSNFMVPVSVDHTQQIKKGVDLPLKRQVVDQDALDKVKQYTEQYYQHLGGHGAVSLRYKGLCSLKSKKYCFVYGLRSILLKDVTNEARFSELLEYCQSNKKFIREELIQHRHSTFARFFYTIAKLLLLPCVWLKWYCSDSPLSFRQSMFASHGLEYGVNLMNAVGANNFDYNIL